ncbi:HAD family hydrolase, partial [Undibacterium squillarum]|uniref:HAD family hydrolase n=1 Tax=Undibacterium squillarum TaxID=1131567 RepID=UPI0035AFC51B
MTIKAILFDLDDTLWPVGPVIRHAEQALHDWLAVHTPQVTAAYDIEGLRRRRQALVPTNPRFSYDLWSLRHRLLQDVMAEQGADPAHADAAMQVFAQARNQVSLYDDVLPALQQLQADFITGSVSNGFADLNSIGLAPYFRVSLAAHSFGCAKPDPRIFLA